jgi:hypothetical protein
MVRSPPEHLLDNMLHFSAGLRPDGEASTIVYGMRWTDELPPFL